MTRPGALTHISQHLTVCIECEDEPATAWCEDCRTSLCEECDRHQHHSKSLRREHVRIVIKPSEAPGSSGSRTGLLSQAFAAEAKSWPLSGESEDSAEEGPPGAFSPSVKLESGTSHHGLKAKRKHKKKKRGKSKGQHEKERVASERPESRGQEGDGEPSSLEQLGGQDRKGKGVEKDRDSAGSSSVENPLESPAWKKRKSALKGSHERAGESPRQPLHVHWSPNVKDITADSHSPSFGSPRRFVPYISNRRKKYAEKHHHKHHKGGGEHGDKRGKGKGRKGHEAARSSGSRKAHLERVPSTGLGDVSESADSDTFSPAWPKDSSDKSEGTSDDSSFEDKMDPSPDSPKVELKLPEARKKSADDLDHREGLGEGKREGPSEAGFRKSAEMAVHGREGAALKAAAFGEIVSSSGAEDTGEESVTEDDSMAGGMDLDSSETEMLTKEQPPGRSWKWFERFMGKKKGEAGETCGGGRSTRQRKGPRYQGVKGGKKGEHSHLRGEKSPLSTGPGGDDGREHGSDAGLPDQHPLVEESEQIPVQKESGQGRLESGRRLAPESGHVLKAICEYEAAIRFFRSQFEGAGEKVALKGEAGAWVEIAALQKRDGKEGAASRSYLAAARVYHRLGMETEVGECLEQARAPSEGVKAKGDPAVVPRELETRSLDEKETGEECEKQLDDANGVIGNDETTRGTCESGDSSSNLGESFVQGSTLAVSNNPHPVQSDRTKQDEEQGLVYDIDEAKGPTSKKGSKRKGKGATTKTGPEASLAKTTSREGPEDGEQENPKQQEITEPRTGGNSHGPNKRDAADAARSIDTTAAIAKSRQSGAAAMASGDAEKGRALLVGALVAARKAGVKTEEARCLRLLADSQAIEDQRVRALESAVEGMRASGLKIEEAEALYRLANTKLSQCLANKVAMQAAVAGETGKEELALVESARESLLSAAAILQAAELWKRVDSSPEAPRRDILSPTRTNRPEVVTGPARGRIAARNWVGGENEESGSKPAGKGLGELAQLKAKGPTASKAVGARSPTEVRTLKELYGAVCQSVGKASVLLGQFGAAKKSFQEALSNAEWTAKYGDEAKRAQEILGRLPR